MSVTEKTREQISSLLTVLRLRKGYSQSKMASLLGIDRHTWIRWESGESVPSIDDLTHIYRTLDEPILRPLLDILYPDNTHPAADMPIEKIRKDIAEYFLYNASDHAVRVCAFLMNGPHGSDIDAQLEEFCAIDHLPVQYRYFIAEQIYIYYMMARQRKELILTDSVMPDIDAFVSGLKSVQKSAFDKLKK